MEFTVREINDSELGYADLLLNKLIIDEYKYDKNINENYKIEKYYENKENTCLSVAIDDAGNIVGYIFGYIDSHPVYVKPKAILDALYVDDKFRGNGIATKLIDFFERWAKNRSISIIELTVCSKNIDAYNLYEKNGFDDVKVVMSKLI